MIGRMLPLALLLSLLFLLAGPCQAMEYTAPEPPAEAEGYMPRQEGSFGGQLWELFRKAMGVVDRQWRQAAGTGLGVAAAVLLVSLLKSFRPEGLRSARMAGAMALGALLLRQTDAMIRLGMETVEELSQYGKLLLPVLAAALGAQGGVTSSAALYAGTAVFDSLLMNLLSRLLSPMVYLFLALAVGNSATGENMLKKLRDLIKGFMSWCLRITLTVFTSYMSITGVVSGATDAAALKATKVTISTVVPVVGGILSDASEAVLVGARVMKNTAGSYGILAALAVFLAPFLRIGVHYLTLKATAAVCAIFDGGGMSELIEDFGTAMGLLLAMTGASCLLLLISTVCFMRLGT